MNLDIESIDSNIFQLLGTPVRTLVLLVTQLFRSKWLHFFFQWLTRNSILPKVCNRARQNPIYMPCKRLLAPNKGSNEVERESSKESRTKDSANNKGTSWQGKATHCLCLLYAWWCRTKGPVQMYSRSISKGYQRTLTSMSASLVTFSWDEEEPYKNLTRICKILTRESYKNMCFLLAYTEATRRG